MTGGRYIFTSDLHLGAECPRDTEAEFIAFLDGLPTNTKALYLLGDVFDFWFEKRSRPCGFEAVLEALRGVVGRGIGVYFLKGNHDWWTFGQLERLSGVTLLQPQPVEITLEGKRFCLAHGDGLGKDSFKERITQLFLKGRVTIFLARWLTPARWLDAFARTWAGSSRRRNNAHPYVFSEASPLWKYTCQREKEHPADFFIYGHIHSPVTMDTPMGATMYILDDWSSGPSWLEWDGENMTRGAGVRHGSGDPQGGTAESTTDATTDGTTDGTTQGCGGIIANNQHLTENTSPVDEGRQITQSADSEADTLHTGDGHPGGSRRSEAGIAVPLAQMRSLGSRGCGDLGCLKLLADLACKLGVGRVTAMQVIDTASATSQPDWRVGFPIYPALADLQALEPLPLSGRLADYLEKTAALEAEARIDFSKVYNAKMHYLNERFAQEGGRVLSSDAYHSFWRANRHWLELYSAYCVLRHKYGTGDNRYWSEPEYERLLEDESFIREYSADMRFHLYVQFILHNQLEEALAYAAQKGVTIDFTPGQEKLPQTIRQWWAGLGPQERQAECVGALGVDIQAPQELESWIAEGILRRRLKDASYRANIPLEDLLGITSILPRAAADPAAGGERTYLRMPVRLESILEHKALLEQIRKVAESSMG